MKLRLWDEGSKEKAEAFPRFKVRPCHADLLSKNGEAGVKSVLRSEPVRKSGGEVQANSKCETNSDGGTACAMRDARCTMQRRGQSLGSGAAHNYDGRVWRLLL